MQVSGFELIEPTDARLWGEYNWNCRVSINEAVLWDKNRKPVCYIQKGKLTFYLHHAESFDYYPDSLQAAMTFVEYVFATYSINELDRMLDCRKKVEGAIHIQHKTLEEVFSEEIIL